MGKPKNARKSPDEAETTAKASKKQKVVEKVVEEEDEV